MSYCSTNSCESGSCSKMCGVVTGILRMALGAAWIFFGVSKFGAPAEKMEFIGSAATKLFPFLDFLSTSVRFWVAAITQILIGLILLAGNKKLTKCAAVTSLIMLVFISHATGMREPKTVLLAAVGTMIVYKGTGSFVICPWSCGKDGDCSTGSCSKKNDEEIIEA